MTRRILGIFLAFGLLFTAGLGTLAASGGKDKVFTDDLIYDNVKRRLATDGDVKGAALYVDVKDGVVTLKGTLDSEKSKEKAGKITRKVKGVRSVSNEIQVQTK